MRSSLLWAVVWNAGCGGLLFHPMKPWLRTPADLGLGYRDVILRSASGPRIHGWWLPARGEPKGTVYFLHGNAENVSTHIGSVFWLPAAGFNVFLIDYRGYGMSEGQPHLPEVFDDIQLGLDWVSATAHGSNRPVIVFGESLGATLSIWVLARPENIARFDCAVLEAGFARYRDVTSDVLRRSWLLWPLRPLVVPLMPARWDAEDVIGGIKAPVLVLHSRDDEIVPYTHGLRLFAAATPPKEFQPLSGPHITAINDPQVRRRLLDFISDHCDGGRQSSGAPAP
jgi:alpha-beta hydrolase superfamily lysophospholipase